MATIRIVDDWLRSPASAPSHYRSVMVIAEKWAEQRVLMRAYAESRDQTRPTIMLHGIELAIGPAGLDINGSWGVHVGDPENGRAQHIKEHLEAAARRLAGSKGNPPRLVDEEPTFEREPTANWGPGAPRILPKPHAHAHAQPQVDYVAPSGAAWVPQGQGAAAYVPQASAVHHAPQPAGAAAPSNPEQRVAPLPRPRRATRQPHPQPQPSRTALGYSSGAGAQSAVVRLGLAAHVSARLGRLVDRVVPPDFHIDARERRVLNTLGDGELTARAIGLMIDVTDAVAFMEELTRKLERYHLDLIEPGEPMGGEPTYRLRR
ncbi:MAG TPA: hypothetical protein VK932_09265 [Kofleriaceae bacterium]|nr:hypothetical protein [Kofleriaceae bacterium]